MKSVEVQELGRRSERAVFDCWLFVADTFQALIQFSDPISATTAKGVSDISLCFALSMCCQAVCGYQIIVLWCACGTLLANGIITLDKGNENV